MNSKKSRAEAAKAENEKQLRLAMRAATGIVMGRAAIPPGYTSPGSSTFLSKLPREVRDRIYEELLVIRRDEEIQALYDEIQAGIEAGAPAWQCEVALDIMDQDLMIMPDMTQRNKGVASIADNLGILSANKQIWDEATDTLFGKNLFGAGPQHERVDAFWRCSIYCRDVPRNRPCQVRPETAVKIKHLFILVALKDESANLPATAVPNMRINLRTIVDTFNECGTHFLTLNIRFWGQFSGEVEAMRDEIEGPLHPLMPERPPVMLRHATTGKFWCIKAKDINTKIFKNVGVLEELKKLKGVAEQVDIRGDIPAKFIDELTKILIVSDPGPAAIRTQRAKAALVSRQPKPSGNLQAMAAEKLAEDPNMSPGSRKMWEDLMKSSRKSPAVMHQMFAGLRPPPGSRRISPGSLEAAMPSGADVGGNAHNSEGATADGGIGMLNGKPIFGPPRPSPSD